MSHTPHELAEEFSEDRPVIDALAAADARFAELAATYEDVNQEIIDIEAEIRPASDDVLTDLRRKRLHLKDEIAAAIAATRRAVA